MIVVHAYLSQHFPIDKHADLVLACEEIVPAALNCGEEDGKDGKHGLVDGIKFLTHPVWPGQGDKTDEDVFLEIEACDHPERAANQDQRQANIRTALTQLFRGYSFGVWLKLVKASCDSGLSDPDSPRITDMSTEAAVSRAREGIDYWRQR